MTALRWFLSYLLPMLLITSIAAAYFYREKISSDWYRTLTWPVSQINAVLQKQRLALNVVNPAVSTELVSKANSKPAISTVIENTLKNSNLSDSPAASEIKANNESDLDIKSTKPLMHPIDSPVAINSDNKASTPLMHPVAPEASAIPLLPKTTEIIKSKSMPQKMTPEQKLAMTPQHQQQFTPYPQQRMMPPPVMKPVTPRYYAPRFNSINRTVPKPPTHFKLNKKQLKLLYKARKAFWTNDFKTAKKHYLTLSNQLSDNPDIQGELGNLYYRERKLESAIKHYSKAAKLLIKHRHYWKLPQIMRIISRFNPAKANEVMQLMHNNNSKKGK